MPVGAIEAPRRAGGSRTGRMRADAALRVDRCDRWTDGARRGLRGGRQQVDGLDPLRETIARRGETHPELPRMGDEPAWHGAHEKPQPCGSRGQQVGRERQPLESQRVIGLSGVN